jgi:hypothetical protein
VRRGIPPAVVSAHSKKSAENNSAKHVPNLLSNCPATATHEGANPLTVSLDLEF